MKIAGFALLALCAVACGGSGGGETGGCRSNADCSQGLVCVVPASGQRGSCQQIPIHVTMTAPGPNTRVGKAGVPVTAEVTLGAADANAPAALVLIVASDSAGTLSQTGRDGARVSYAGTYVPPADASFTGTMFVAAETSAGLVPSDGILVAVDTKAPALAVVGSGIGCRAGLAACARDDLLGLLVSAQDDHLDAVEATLDLDGDVRRAPLAAGELPGQFVANVPLASYPFPRFSGSVRARVHARDQFGNETVIETGSFPVTRKRWEYDAGAPVTGPAVATDGTVVVGVSSTADNLRAIRPDGTENWRTTLAPAGRTVGSFVTSAPSVGSSTVWAGSDDGRLYGRTSAGSVFGCPAAGPTPGAMFTPALVAGSPDLAFSGGSSANLFGAASTPACAGPTATAEAPGASPVIVGGKIFTASSTSAIVQRFTTALANDGLSVTPSVNCSTLAGPPAAMNGKIVLACGIAQGRSEIHVIDPASSSATLAATLAARPVESIVITSTGDLVVGANDGRVHRLTPPAGAGTWTEKWSPAPDLHSPVTGTVLAQAGAAGDPVVYAVTSAGQLHALDDAGAVVWSTASEATPPTGTFALTFPTIAPAASANALPTLYVGSAEGKLYAVVVDAGLDTASPWPKSHHDLRNTGNAAAPLP